MNNEALEEIKKQVMEKYILNGLIAIIIFATYSLLAKGSDQKVVADQGMFILKMNRLFAIFGKILITLSIIALLIPLYYPNEEDYLAMIISMGATGIIFGGSGYLLLIIYKNHSLEYQNSKFKVKSYFGKEISGQISEITNVKYNAFTNLIVIYMDNGEKIKCSQFLVGIIRFLENIEKEKGFELGKIKRQILWK